MFALFIIAHHFCGYDAEIKRGNITMHTEKLISKKSIKSGAQWKNIRIHFDYRYMDGTRKDSKMCTYVGEQIKWGYESEAFTCSKYDILNQSQIAVIKGTFENVRIYLQKLLKVIPLTSSFKLQSFDDYLEHTNFDTIYNADLYMAITLRPRRPFSANVASAGPIALESTFSRPYMGGVYVNPRRVPSSIQSEKTWQNDAFWVYVHEIFHALGFPHSKFHPYEDPTPYKDPKCSLTVKGKKMTFLTTPHARIYAKKHYGVTEFIGDGGSHCPAGIEIEDGGGGGTAGSHLEERTFMSEVMTGVTIQTENGPFNRLTDASLAVLQDTGNYKCDYRMAQPLVWGHPESINGKPIPNFGTGPWQIVFPEGYVYNDTYPYDAGFDYKFHGPYSKNYNVPYCTTASTDKYCVGKNFYNPINGDIGTEFTFDYMVFKYPNNVCEKGKAILPHDKNAYPLACGEYTCNGYDSFTWRSYNKQYDASSYLTISCNKSNIGQFIDSKYMVTGFQGYARKVKCPDPERFCRTMKLYEAYFEHDPFDENYKVLEPYVVPSKSSQSSNVGPSKPTDQPNKPVESSPSQNQPSSTDVEGEKDSSKEKNTDDKKKIDAGTIFFICLGCAIGIIVIALVALIIVKCRQKETDSDDIINKDLTANFIV